jgi:PAS domain S-box-containing protein
MPQRQERRLKPPQPAAAGEPAAAAHAGASPEGSDAAFRALAASVQVGIFRNDVEGRCTFVSPRWSEMTGLTLEESLGMGWKEAIHPEDRARVLAEWQEASRLGRDSHVEYRLKDRDGRVMWVSGHAVALHDDAGRVTGYVGTLIDVTDHRRALDELVEQRAFLRRVIDLDPNFVFAKDREGRFTLVNQAVADAYGTTVEALIGSTDADFDPSEEEVASFRRDDLEVMDSLCPKLVPEEVITDATGRTRYLQTIKIPIVGPDGQAHQVLGVSTDITARKVLEDRLAQAQKLEAIGRLAGGVAHDFNNLLTVILGSAELLLTDLQPGDTRHTNAEEIRRAAERAAMLTRQLLAFSRKQVLQPRVLDVNRVVLESVRMLRHLIGEHVEIVTALDAPHASVKADPVQLTQVVLNLSINARDAMPQGGTLTIRTALESIAEDDAAAPLGVAPGEYVTIAVHDTGLGIAPDALPHVFEPFFTTKPLGQGTGLGLATSYGIVQQSGGHLTLASDPGHGATFVVHLPRVEAAAEEREERPPGSPGGHETILLVEDEPMVRSVAARALRARGYQVLEAEGGARALEIARAHRGPIHLLVTDVVMPQMSGLELAAQFARARPETRVLYASGYTERPAGLRGALERGIEFLPKPYVPETLTRRVREVLDGRRG